jgi:NTE family protein/lysophospholipid hydrolase
MERDLKRMFGTTTIEMLWRPFFAAACNLSQAATTVLDSGLLWRAVLASNSPAGLLPPVVRNGDLLVDGAILDNIPVAAMRARLGTPLEKRHGNGTVIAVDVDIRDELAAPPDTQRLSARETLKAWLGLGTCRSPGIGDILYRAGHIGSLQQKARTSTLADRYLAPPVDVFPLMAYRQAEAIVAAGYRHACEEIARWNSR